MLANNSIIGAFGSSNHFGFLCGEGVVLHVGRKDASSFQGPLLAMFCSGLRYSLEILLLVGWVFVLSWALSLSTSMEVKPTPIVVGFLPTTLLRGWCLQLP